MTFGIMWKNAADWQMSKQQTIQLKLLLKNKITSL